MTRPTIRDLAQEAGVSVSTVNRVLAGDSTVRDHTVQQVKDTAERIGYYGVRAIQAKIIARKPKLKFGFLLHQPTRKFYKLLGTALETAARAHGDQKIETEIFYAEDLAPSVIAAKLIEFGERCHAVGVVTAVHPLVTNAVNILREKNVPEFALISQQPIRSTPRDRLSLPIQLVDSCWLSTWETTRLMRPWVATSNRVRTSPFHPRPK